MIALGAASSALVWYDGVKAAVVAFELFSDEVFDGHGKLREIHRKYPVDLGHQRVEGEES